VEYGTWSRDEVGISPTAGFDMNLARRIRLITD